MRNVIVTFFVTVFVCGCGAEVFVDLNATTEQPDAAIDASVDAAVDASVDAAEDTGPPPSSLCHCPNATPCVKPFECCQVVGQCKNPANFNCTGSAMMCP